MTSELEQLADQVKLKLEKDGKMTTTNQPKSVDATTIAQLKALGFSDVQVDIPRRLIASISGKEKTGKTHFCLTAPSPIVFFNIDLGTEGVVEKFQAGFGGQPPKQVLINNIRIPKGAKQDIYATMWRELWQKVETAYKLHTGTIVLDTSTEAYEMCRLAHFGKLTQVMPHQYAVVNNDWREFMRMAYDSTANTLLIHKVKPKYVNNVRTSEYEISGMSEIPYLVQANLTTFRDDSSGEQTFGITIIDCRQNPVLSGTVLRGPTCNFDFVLGLVHDN